MNELLKEVYLSNEKTFLDNYPRLQEFHNGDCTSSHSTSFVDCTFLYLLALRVKPNIVFEAGTWIGSTAKFLAEGCGLRKDCVHTCDIPANTRGYIPSERHDESIVRHGHGVEALIEHFKRNKMKADLVFFDADFFRPRVFNNLLEVVSDDFVFAAHDYTESDGDPSKGQTAANEMLKHLKPKGYQLFVPKFSKYTHGHYVDLGPTQTFCGINGCTVALTPPNFIRNLEPGEKPVDHD
jgi:predicted O-methyltransferase YrrM